MRKTQIILFLLTVNFFFFSCGKIYAPRTIENLNTAYLTESGDYKKYTKFASKAREEGFVIIASLFEAVSFADSINALNLKEEMQKLKISIPEVNPVYEIKTTKENVENALKSEGYKMSTLYPGCIAKATSENVYSALNSFNQANNSDRMHRQLFMTALNALNTNVFTSLSDVYFVCPECGNTIDITSKDKECPVCKTPREKYKIFKN
jgi:rubrerythrin